MDFDYKYIYLYIYINTFLEIDLSENRFIIIASLKSAYILFISYKYLERFHKVDKLNKRTRIVSFKGKLPRRGKLKKMTTSQIIYLFSKTSLKV